MTAPRIPFVLRTNSCAGQLRALVDDLADALRALGTDHPDDIAGTHADLIDGIDRLADDIAGLAEAVDRGEGLG